MERADAGPGWAVAGAALADVGMLWMEVTVAGGPSGHVSGGVGLYRPVGRGGLAVGLAVDHVGAIGTAGVRGSPIRAWDLRGS
jgi:hypothetical protein